MRAEGYSEAAGTRLQYVLLDMSPVTHLDSTGVCVCCVHAACCVCARVVCLGAHLLEGCGEIQRGTKEDTCPANTRVI